MNYNRKRHIQLLKRSQDLNNQGKRLFIENPEEHLEFSKYVIAVHEHFFWQDRYEVLLLMEDFVNRKIDGEELCDGVYGFRRKLIDTCEKFDLELTSGSETIQAFQLDGGKKDLSGILTALFFKCDDFCEDYENEEFCTSIKKGFLNFQKALNEE